MNLNLDNPGPGKIVLAFSAMMVVIFLGLGYFFVFTNSMIDRFPRPNRVYIGLVLSGWAIFRGVSVWIKFKRMKDENEEE